MPRVEVVGGRKSPPDSALVIQQRVITVERVVMSQRDEAGIRNGAERRHPIILGDSLEKTESVCECEI